MEIGNLDMKLFHTETRRRLPRQLIWPGNGSEALCERCFIVLFETFWGVKSSSFIQRASSFLNVREPCNKNCCFNNTRPIFLKNLSAVCVMIFLLKSFASSWKTSCSLDAVCSHCLPNASSEKCSQQWKTLRIKILLRSRRDKSFLEDTIKNMTAMVDQCSISLCMYYKSRISGPFCFDRGSSFCL